jgi:SAM-dependent methyltransferase
MASIEENLKHWNEDNEWQAGGDIWSQVWGGVASQWYGTILPRIRSYVPASTILEIAPGFGRWTGFLLPLCRHLVVVDLSPKCIEACRRRFADYSSIEYHVNDGRLLEDVRDESIDFAFSFDSLVHVEIDVLIDYFAQLARKLTPNGVAFMHHSNVGEFVDRESGQLPQQIDNRPWRAMSVSAEAVRLECSAHGLCCLSQEIVTWGKDLIDAITVVAPPGSRWARDCVVMRNTEFMREAAYAASLAQLYGRDDVAARLPGGE